MNDPVDPNMQTGQNGQSDSGLQNNASQGQGQGMPTTPTPPVPPTGQPGSNLSGIMDENVDVSNLVANAGQNQQDSAALMQMPIAAHPNTIFDEKRFLELLTGSISLTINEKRKIIEAIPQLSQFQIDELIKIFEEEKGKFAELEQKHSEQIADLEKQHAGSIHDVQAQQEEAAQKSAEEDEAERIKRELGLGGGFGSPTFQLEFVINGQVFGRAEAQNDITAEEAIMMAKQDPNVAQVLEGRQIMEETYIPGKMVNIGVQ